MVACKIYQHRIVEKSVYCFQQSSNFLYFVLYQNLYSCTVSLYILSETKYFQYVCQTPTNSFLLKNPSSSCEKYQNFNYLFIYLDETNVSRCCISQINYIESLLLQGNNGKDQSVLERHDPKDLSTFSVHRVPLSQGI